jgi:hypothetical protein
MSKPITWNRIESVLPDVDTNVLLGLSDGFSCEGFLDDQQWRDVCGMPMDDGSVVAWAEMPRCVL